jgi:hypothetical protein
MTMSGHTITPEFTRSGTPHGGGQAGESMT